MKRYFRIELLVMIAILSFLMGACEKSHDDLAVEQQYYAKKLNNEIDQVSERIVALIALADSTETQQKQKLETSIADLEKKQTKLDQSWDTIWQATKENWKSVKIDLDNQFASAEKVMKNQNTMLNYNKS